MAIEGSRDLVLAQGSQAFILDETKGNVSSLVGPYKYSLSNNDKAVVWDSQTRQFVQTRSPEEAVTPLVLAEQNQYIVLANPAAQNVHPKSGTSNQPPDLEFGRQVIIPGPLTFALWPGQEAEVIAAHTLRTNQYIVVRVVNDAEASANWRSAVLKPQAQSGSEASQPDEDAAAAIAAPRSFVNGQLLIIRGTDVSFFIPPTGVEVVKDETGKYVRDAVTLEQKQYCILLGENGEKRFVPGPAVVFPEATETFVVQETLRVFNAYELGPNTGIYIKVVETYTDEGDGGFAHEEGEELFITGKEQPFYTPRREHSLVTYGDKVIHYAVAIPVGEGRYVLDRNTGVITLVQGPAMFLPNPINQVVVKRILDPRMVNLLFPGNREAQDHNTQLAERDNLGDYAEEATTLGAEAGSAPRLRSAHLLGGQQINRGTTHKPPRTITLESKFDGAVLVSVWEGYALALVSKTGDRRVVVGPTPVLLEYDEVPTALTLSTGKPKSDNRPIRTAYLRVRNNVVSDIIDVETADYCQIKITVSYRVNFEGDDPERWFAVENYIQLLADHARSRIRNAVKRLGVEEFHANAIDVVRDTLLGPSPGDGHARTGLKFDENNMRLYDVEVLDVEIGDQNIQNLLVGAQHEAVRDALEIARKERQLGNQRRIETVARESARENEETSRVISELKEVAIARNKSMVLAETAASLEQALAKSKASLKEAAELAKLEEERRRLETAVAEHKRQLDLAAADQRLLIQTNQDEQQLTTTKAKTDLETATAREMAELDTKRERELTSAIVERLNAANEKLIAALTTFGDQHLAIEAAKAMGPLSIIRNIGVGNVLGKLFEGTTLGKTLSNGDEPITTNEAIR